MSILFILAGCGSPAVQAEAADANGLIHHEDGSYSYGSALDGVGQQLQVGAITWEHVDAARFTSATPATGPFVDDPNVESTIHDLVRVDDQGRLWRVAALDRELQADAIARYDKSATDEEDLIPSYATGDSGDEDTGAEDGSSTEEPGWIEFESYTTVNCADELGVGENNAPRNHVWSSGSEDIITYPEVNTYENDPVVYISTGTGGLGVACSGVLVRDNVVLTAAHCVVDPATGAFLDPTDAYNGFRACTRGNNLSGSTCSRGTNLVVSSNFTAGSTMTSKHDWALVELLNDLGGSDNKMYLSSASSSTIKAGDAWLSGYPGIKNSSVGCISNTTSSAHSLMSDGRWQHQSEGEVNTAWSQSLIMDLTHGDGYSGGPYFYDPGSSGGRRYSIGVHSGHWWNLTGWQGAKGPRTSYNRDDWITIITDDL